MRILRRSGFGKPIVVDIRVNREDLMRRLTGRWMCSIGGEIYNIYDAPPKVHGICDMDGGKLVQRSDDRPEVVKQRLATYDEKTKPLTDYYRRQGVLETVDGIGTMEQVNQRSCEKSWSARKVAMVICKSAAELEKMHQAGLIVWGALEKMRRDGEARRLHQGTG